MQDTEVDRKTEHEPDLQGVAWPLRALLASAVLVFTTVVILWLWMAPTQPNAVEAVLSPLPWTEPMLQVSPEDDFKQWQGREQSQLNSTGWVDREAGIIHIPIAQAISIVVSRESHGRESRGRESHGKEEP